MLFLKACLITLLLAIQLILLPVAAEPDEELPNLETKDVKALDQQQSREREAQIRKLQKNWDERVQRWDVGLNRLEKQLNDENFLEEDSESKYSYLDKLSKESLQIRDKTERELFNVERLLSALGARPDNEQQREAQSIRLKREEYTQKVSLFKQQLKQIDLLQVRKTELTRYISERRRGLKINVLLERYPRPLGRTTLLIAGGEVLQHIELLLLGPQRWFDTLSNEQKQQFDFWPSVLIIFSLTVLGFFLRKWILEQYGRDPSNLSPAPTRKLNAALAEGVARGLVPLFVFVGLFILVLPNGVQHTEMVLNTLGSITYFIVLSTFTASILSPDLPQWRLTRLSPVATRVVGYGIISLLAASVLDEFLMGATSTESFDLSIQLRSVYISLATLIKTSLIVLICWYYWWDSSSIEDSDEKNAVTENRFFIDYIRRVILFIAVASSVAALVGYAKLAMYLMENLIHSIVVVLVFMGIRSVLQELLNALVRSGLLRKKMGLRILTLQRIKVWVGSFISLSIVLITASTTAIVWGVSEEDLIRFVYSGFTKIEVGSISFSLTDIVSAIFVFIITMMLTRLLQRALLNHILPQFISNRSAQHSLVSGAGYIGIVVAITLFVAALGINLESIALVAGALSVGIGFGLQNIVSNFVSGVILILERPIKVDDWIKVGNEEGFVKQINFRATELETFTRATVIIPNSEMLSSSVTNMTYKDRNSRVEVVVQVAYGTKVDLVKDILTHAAQNSEETLNYPESTVLLQDFAADGLTFELRCYIGDAVNKMSVASGLRMEILRDFEKHNIEIPFPQRVIHLA